MEVIQSQIDQVHFPNQVKIDGLKSNYVSLKLFRHPINTANNIIATLRLSHVFHRIYFWTQPGHLPRRKSTV